ncbi:MAG: tetratricopeptide repeat protein [Bacteroidia bacterium]|nr:tetratricopeptide repeat protein [Bacteroidia bacterium]MBL4715721.1 tetratricopeptide repeat protein [Bacteroidia bacterium]
MREEFEDEFNEEDQKSSVQRFEEMLRKKDQYFFEPDAFENIIDYYLDKHDPVRALRVVKYAISQYSFDATFLIKKAQILINTTDYKTALEVLDKAEVLEPSSPDILLLRGDAYNYLGCYNEAIKCYTTALPISEDKDEIYLCLATVYQNQGNFEKAIRLLKQCLDENPNNEEILYEIAFCYDLINQSQESIEFYDQFIDKEPYSYAAWYNLGNVYNKLEKYDKAIMAYDYAILIKENFAAAHFNKGNTLANMEKYEDAIEIYKCTFEYESPEAVTYYNIGECYEKLEKMDEARSFYKKATKIDPELAEAWFGIGITLENEERWFESIHFFKKSIKLDSKNPEYWHALGDAEAKLGNVESATGAYKRVAELAPESTDIWMDWSYALFEDKQLDTAIDTLFEGIRHNPEFVDYYYLISVYFFKQNKYKEGAVYLEQALTRDYSKHNLIFEHYPHLKNNKIIQDLINLYKP